MFSREGGEPPITEQDRRDARVRLLLADLSAERWGKQPDGRDVDHRLVSSTVDQLVGNFGFRSKEAVWDAVERYEASGGASF